MTPSGHPISASVPRIALLTYSTKPRGGVVHTVHLAEALSRLGAPVEIFSLGDPDTGFWRETDAPFTIFPAPEPAETLEGRVYAAADALGDALAGVIPESFDLVHAQDCIAARAALGLRDKGVHAPVLRTVHHVDDFTTPALIECQRRSILDPDQVIVVSEQWRSILATDYRITAQVVTNGVDVERFASAHPENGHQLRSEVGANGRFVWLTVGGIEPRKGSQELIEALARLKAGGARPLLVVVGGHSFQDHSAYRQRVFDTAKELGVVEGEDYIVLGTVSDAALIRWYHAADGFVFPSVKEGWGLVVLEAMSAGLPVVLSDIPVFREFLGPQDAVLVPGGDPTALAGAMDRIASDADLRDRLASAGPRVASRFTWEACARQHLDIYGALRAPKSTVGGRH